MDAWVVQSSTGSRAGPESTDGPAIPNPSALLAGHPMNSPYDPNTVVTVIDSMDEEDSSSESSFEDFDTVVTVNNKHRDVASYFMQPHLSSALACD